MLIWPAKEGWTYRIYRSQTRDGEYEQIGTSVSGSYRDDEAEYPQNDYYRVEPVSADGEAGALSQPMQAGTNPQKLSKVDVLMYHNFITDADIANGVEFEEYSLKPEEFEEDLKYFRANGYTTITSADLLDYIDGKKPLPAKAIILSIDDGTLGVYTNAWPLLKKYRMKADFNLIGKNIDAAWETLNDGGTRDGESAPYCQWNEVVRMSRSGEINLCSHTYGLHRYNRQGRIGASLMDGESIEDYIEVVKRDYELTVSCMEGWSGISPKTMAYPYSRRSSETDKAILENTGYEILMAGAGARHASASNYFVDGATPEGYQRLMNRPCRMEGHPAKEYLDASGEEDAANGVNQEENTAALTDEECAEIAAFYSPFADVAGSAWYSGAVYYTYVNSMLEGTSLTDFSPNEKVSRAMAAMLLYRMAGQPDVSEGNHFRDIPQGQWYADAVNWAAECGILQGVADGIFEPDSAVSREQLAECMYRFARHQEMNVESAEGVRSFSDEDEISSWAINAIRWASSNGLIQGDEQGRMQPKKGLTRAELAAVLMNWGQREAAESY